jgi:hypothetical protein
MDARDSRIFSNLACDGDNGGSSMSGTLRDRGDSRAAQIGVIKRPPTALLIGAAATVIVSAALLLTQSLPISVLGYLIAPFATTALVSVYRWKDIERQQDPWYVRSTMQRRAVAVVLAVGFFVGLCHAWIIATELAKNVAG